VRYTLVAVPLVAHLLLLLLLLLVLLLIPLLIPLLLPLLLLWPMVYDLLHMMPGGSVPFLDQFRLLLLATIFATVAPVQLVSI
jgi:hypothetical protein